MNQSILSKEQIKEVLIERHGKQVYEKLKNAHVAIAGLGGLGSNVAVMLTRAGIGSLHLVDSDKVESSNLNRQIYRMKHLGRYKTKALTQELKEINPYIRITEDTIKVTEENAAELFKEDLYICEAFDVPECKAMLINTLLAAREDVFMVAGSGMAGYDSSNQIRTRKRMKNLWVCGDEINGIEEKGSLMAPRVAICAGHQANLLIRLLLGEKEERRNYAGR